MRACQASIFYQDDQDRIVNSVLQCNTTSGQWYDTGEWIISGVDAPRASPATGLAVVLLGADDGYRVFYNDLDGRLQALAYTRATSEWLYNGIVSPDNATVPGAIAATFPGDTNITVITARDGANMEVSRIYADNTWHICK